jgi:hypothetical protein
VIEFGTVRNEEINPTVASSSPTASVTVADWIRISGSCSQRISRVQHASFTELTAQAPK